MFGNRPTGSEKDTSVDKQLQSLIQTDEASKRNMLNNLQFLMEMFRSESEKPVEEQKKNIQSALEKKMATISSVGSSSSSSNSVPTASLNTRKRASNQDQPKKVSPAMTMTRK